MPSSTQNSINTGTLVIPNNLTISDQSATFNLSGTTNVTFPTSGTLATTSLRKLLGTASGGSTTLSFPATIDQTFNHLQLIIMGQASVGADNTLIVNGVTSGYDSVLFYENNGGSATTSTQQNAASWSIGPLAGTTGASAGLYIIDFPFYTNTNWNKLMNVTNGYSQQSSSVNRLTYGVFSNRSTSVITSITITSGSGNFATNTVAYLYGTV